MRRGLPPSHPRYGHIITTPVRIQAILAACPPPPSLGAWGIDLATYLYIHPTYTHRLLFHSTSAGSKTTCLLPPSLPGRLINPSVHLPRLVLGTYILPVSLVLRRSVSALAASHFSHRAGVGRHSNPIQIFFFLSLSDLRPTKGRFCAEPGSSLQGLHLRSTPTTTRGHLHLFTLHLGPHKLGTPIVSFDSPPLPVCPCRKQPRRSNPRPLNCFCAPCPTGSFHLVPGAQPAF